MNMDVCQVSMLLVLQKFTFLARNLGPPIQKALRFRPVVERLRQFGVQDSS